LTITIYENDVGFIKILLSYKKNIAQRIFMVYVIHVVTIFFDISKNRIPSSVFCVTQPLIYKKK